MLKNNKGYLLSETIIAIATVATVITVVYTMSLGNYKKQDIELTKANPTQELYTAKELRKFLYNHEDVFIEQMEGNGYKSLFSKDAQYDATTEEDQFMLQLSEALDIKYIYISDYVIQDLLNDELINSQIKSNLLSKEDENKNVCTYRYLIIYNDNSYSTIGIHCEGAGE